MKFFVVFLAIVAAVQADGWTLKSVDEMKAAHTQCAAENQVSEENIAKMKNSVYSDDESVRNYMICCFKKLDLFSIEVGFYTDRLVEQFRGDLPVAEVKVLVDDCFDTNEQESPLDVWVYRAHNCFLASKIGQDAVKLINSVIF